MSQQLGSVLRGYADFLPPEGTEIKYIDHFQAHNRWSRFLDFVDR